MGRLTQQSVLCVLLILFTATLTRCALLEMARVLWNKTVSGGLTKIGRLDPLRVPVIKVDQSEGDTSYRLILRNLEIVGLNASTLESIHVARGRPRSDLSETDAGYVSYSDLRDVDSVTYRFHTMMREPTVSKEGFEAAEVSPVNRAAGIGNPSRYQQSRRLQQERYVPKTFERSQSQYDRQTHFRPDHATSDAFYRSNLKASSNFDPNRGNLEGLKRPAYVQQQRARDFPVYQGNLRNVEDTIDCDDIRVSQFRENQKDNQQYEQQRGTDGRHYGERIEHVEVSASETVETRLKNQGEVRPPVLYNREFKRPDVAFSGDVRLSKDGMKERSGFIDIVYADDRGNGSVKRFGNLGVESKGDRRRVYNIEDIMKNIRESTRFIIYNYTEGEALRKRNDIVKAAIDAKILKDLTRYARNYQEQQGYFEEGMQLIYHYGGVNSQNDSVSQHTKLNDTKRTKRAHPEEVAEDDVMHVILRIRVPLLCVKSQYTLMGKVGKEMLRGNGLLTGNFTDVVGDFTLELKKVNEEVMIVRAAKAKLSAKDRKISFQGMNEEEPVQVILNHGLMAAEAVAAMLADNYATKGLSEKTTDALIYKMYKDLPVD